MVSAASVAAGLITQMVGFDSTPHFNFSSLIIIKMKEFLITILILMAIWPAISQTPSVQNNVSVGESTILAYYPEMAEFVLSPLDGNVTILRYDRDGNERSSTYKAIITQTAPDLYRAEFCGDSWLELDTTTGATTMCHKGNMEAFFPPGIVGK